MSARETLLRLADRCEAAGGPDLVLNVAIDMAMGRGNTHVIQYADGQSQRVGWVTDHSAPYSHRECPAFTASLDVAMTLVPEGWRVNSADWSIKGRFTWMLRGPCSTYVDGPDGYKEAGGDWYASGLSLATPALALCAAALRARAEGVE